MKTLMIYQIDRNFFEAAGDWGNDIVGNLTGSIFNMWCDARCLISDDASFKYEEFSFHCNDYQVDYEPEINGYEVMFNDGIFNDGSVCYIYIHEITQQAYLSDNKLSDDKKSLLNDFVAQINLLKEHFC